MLPDIRLNQIFLIAVFCLTGTAQAAEMLTLQNNPFSRPKILNTPPPPPPPSIAVQAAQVIIENMELKVTATMVSKNAPMAIVEGKLLAIGEKIGEFKLVEVDEGKAVFVRKGKKHSFMITDK